MTLFQHLYSVLCDSCLSVSYLESSDGSSGFASPPGVGVEGAGCERADLLLSASAAFLRQHLLCGVGSEAGHSRGSGVRSAGLSHTHHAEGDQGNAEASVVQSKALS